MSIEQLRIPYELPILSPKFTPGEWSYTSDAYSAPVLMIACPDGKHPAHELRPSSEKEANANLWACAPELFNQLRIAATLLAKIGLESEAATAFSALKKASGVNQ